MIRLTRDVDLPAAAKARRIGPTHVLNPQRKERWNRAFMEIASWREFVFRGAIIRDSDTQSITSLTILL
jgi:hypothetical protein